MEGGERSREQLRSSSGQLLPRAVQQLVAAVHKVRQGPRWQEGQRAWGRHINSLAKVERQPRNHTAESLQAFLEPYRPQTAEEPPPQQQAAEEPTPQQGTEEQQPQATEQLTDTDPAAHQDTSSQKEARQHGGADSASLVPAASTQRTTQPETTQKDTVNDDEDRINKVRSAMTTAQAEAAEKHSVKCTLRSASPHSSDCNGGGPRSSKDGGLQQALAGRTP